MTPYIWPNRNSTYIPWSEIMPNVADYSTYAPDIKVEQLYDMVYGSCEKNVELKSCELSDIV